jgi:hypothetical protein
MTLAQTLTIEEYSFHEFLDKFQTAVLDGYRLDLESNERFPQRFGTLSTVILVKENLAEEKVVEVLSYGTPTQASSDETQVIKQINKEQEAVCQLPQQEPSCELPQQESSCELPQNDSVIKSKGRPKKS